MQACVFGAVATGDIAKTRVRVRKRVRVSIRVRVRVMKLRCTLSYSFERLLFHGLKNKDSFTFICFYKFVPVIEVWYFLTDQLLFMGAA